MHFERSLMYHKLIMEDLIRITFWIRQVDKEKADRLLSYLQNMTDCLYSLEKGMGKTPFFNDAEDEIAKECPNLLKTVRELFNINPVEKFKFPDAGYYKIYEKNKALMFDAGKLGPDYQVGHSHCDTLSFEMSINGKPFIVNSGTYEYQGKHRNFFRSTESNNTILINNKQQSDYWKEHRVAQRIRDVHLDDHSQSFVSAHFEDISGNVHYRYLSFLNKDTLLIYDRIFPDQKQIIRSYLHFAPNYTVNQNGNNIQIETLDHKIICHVIPFGQYEIKIHRMDSLSVYAPEFGRLERNEVIELVSINEKQSIGFLIDFNSVSPDISGNVIERCLNK